MASRRSLAHAMITLAGLLLGAPAIAQEPDGADGRNARLTEMEGLVRAIRVTAPPEEAPVPLIPQPLHRWNDPTREFSDGSLWAAGATGRPRALIAVELYTDPQYGEFWAYELVSLAPGPIEAEADGRYVPLSVPYMPGAGGPLRWSPRQAGVTMTPIADAPEPAATDAARLRQMKALLARVSAHEVGGNQPGAEKTELRPLPRPIHRYADPSRGLTDGALFLFAYGTNPELLVLIEAIRDANQPRWQLGFARLSRAAPTARLDGHEAWSRPYADAPAADDPYYITRTTRTQPRHGDPCLPR